MKQFAFGFLVASFSLLPAFGDDAVNLQIIHRIKAEAFGNSKVMDHLFYLTDANGSRLTGSPGWDRAASWAMSELKKFGADHIHLEPWGPFEKSWSFSRFHIQMEKPVYAPLHGIPMAWSGGTDGPVRGEVIPTHLFHDDEDLWTLDIATIRERILEYEQTWKGKLAGKIVLIGRERDFDQPSTQQSHRLDDKALASVGEETELAPTPKNDWLPDRLPRDRKKRDLLFRRIPLEIMADYWERQVRALEPLNGFLRAETVVAVLRADRRGMGGTVFAEAVSSPDAKAPVPPPTAILAPEHFNRLWRLAEKGIQVEVQLDLAVAFHDSPPTANVIAEIPGDTKSEEVVMLGGHLDSWHAGTGATDNGAGCAVVMEALRILKSLDVKMDRTVRLALWSGEEQGIYGSRAYVREHFANVRTMSIQPEHDKLSAYFNLDNGSGKIRGIHLQGNDMMRPIFESWFAPFKDLGAGTVTIRDTGGTDHLSFDDVSLPGFQFIQDPLDYGTRTHHSELDVYDHAEPGDLMQASAIMASFVYNAATRSDLLPRKPLPKALPPKPKTSH
jgi:carboxypeptidase Q